MSDRSDYEYCCPNNGPSYDCGVVQALRERIKELEANELGWMHTLTSMDIELRKLRTVATAAKAVCIDAALGGSIPITGSFWDKLESALRAAGYGLDN